MTEKSAFAEQNQEEVVDEQEENLQVEESKTKREKFNIRMCIKSASVAVQQQQQLYIEWKRGTHSSKTEKHTVSPDTGEIIFQNFEKGFESKASLFKNIEDDTW